MCYFTHGAVRVAIQSNVRLEIYNDVDLQIERDGEASRARHDHLQNDSLGTIIKKEPSVRDTELDGANWAERHQMWWTPVQGTRY